MILLREWFDEKTIFNKSYSKIQPPLNETRINIIKKAFKKMDKTGDGVITAKDLKGY